MRGGCHAGSIASTLCLALAWLAPAAGAAPADAGYVIYAGSLLADPAKPPMEEVSLLVRGDRVVEIRAGYVDPSEYPSDAKLIDLSSYYVLPGLIDLQVHFTGQLGDGGGAERDVTMTDAESALRAAVYARRTVEAGFTTVREMSTSGPAILALRDGIEAGHVVGPRIQAAGRIIGPELGTVELRMEIADSLPRNALCAKPADCRSTVRELSRQGADTFKVYMNHQLLPDTEPWFSPAELDAIVTTAHALDRKVTASAFGTEPIKAALRAGVDAVVHGVFLDDEAVGLLRERNAYLIPTLSAAETVRELALDEKSGRDPGWRAENLEIHRAMFAGFRRAHAAGCRIAYGTDAGWRAHGDNALQFRLMVDAGMSNAEAIASATSAAADAMGWGDRVGRLLPGFLADVIGVRGDPLQDVSVLEDVSFVMKAGEVILYEAADAE